MPQDVNWGAWTSMSGPFYLKSQLNSKKCMAISDAVDTNGKTIVNWDCRDHDSLKWILDTTL